MKTPAPPPPFDELMTALRKDPDRFMAVLTTGEVLDDRDYLDWDKLRYKAPPDGMSHEEWWLVLKLRRRSMQRPVPLKRNDGLPLTYGLPDELLRALDQVTQQASGQLALPDEVMNAAGRDRYVIASLVEEAISSSQLEGASTSRKEAKRMLAYGEVPKNRSQQMILNNYRAMQRVREIQHEPFTPELICEIHRIVTDKTLDDPHSAGRIQSNPDPEDRVKIFDEDENVLHHPPPVSELPSRMEALCDFANSDSGSDPYVSPVVRALIVHFMMGYDHYFEDGNGRTARALFYWSMLGQGYWLTEHLAISRILKHAPAKYARSFLYTEHDDGDLTYFLMYHLQVIQRAVAELDEYLNRKTLELQRARTVLARWPGGFNHRQTALLQAATKDPSDYYTAESHMNHHSVSKQTARNDLYDLEQRGLLHRTKISRQFAWLPVENLIEMLESQPV